MTNFDGINPNQDRLNIYTPPPRKSKWKKIIILVIVLAILGAGGYAIAHVLAKTNKIFTNHVSIFKRVTSLFTSSGQPLIGEDSGIVNVLLLGVGGEGHDGAYLTDTMIVASINVKTNEVVLTSIPRDWVYQIPNHGLNKINAVYAYGLQDSNNDIDTAGQDAIKAAEQVTGFTIPYYAVVDFKGFVQAVDHVGGIDVYVDNTFTDSSFPNDYPYDTKGYLAPQTFVKGQQHMDGQRALIYARSRHGDNGEGSDFARSERQKKVIIAMKSKLTSLNITNVSTLNNLLSDFSNNFHTNLEPNEMLRLAGIAKNIDGGSVYSLALDPDENLICDTTVDQITGKQYVPPAPTPAPTGTTTSTSSSSSSSSTSTSSSTPATPSPTPTTATPTPATPTQIPMYIVEPCPGKTLTDVNQLLVDYWDVARLKAEGATIEIQNSTGKTSATTAWKQLATDGVNVKFTTYTGKTVFDKTILYDNSQGSKPKTLQYLQGHYSFTTADVQYTGASTADFVIILGNDAL